MHSLHKLEEAFGPVPAKAISESGVIVNRDNHADVQQMIDRSDTPSDFEESLKQYRETQAAIFESTLLSAM